MYVCRHEVDVDQGFSPSVCKPGWRPSWNLKMFHIGAFQAGRETLCIWRSPRLTNWKAITKIFKCNYCTIDLDHFPLPPAPPVIRSHILSLLQCLYFTANYGSSCVITQPTVIPCSRSSAVFFPWHSLHCSPVATLQRRLGEQQSNSPKGKQTIALNSFEWRESSETTGGTWNWIHGSVLYMLAHKSDT